MSKVKVFIESECGHIPAYAHETDAGLDIQAAEDVILAPGETKLIKTGIKLAIPEDYECQVRPRSGLSLNTPLRVANTPGTIDAGYRGEVCVIMQNTSLPFEILNNNFQILENIAQNHFLTSQKGNKQGWYEIKKGDKIAQLVFTKYEKAEFVECTDVKEIGEDRGGGFGSTGIHSDKSSNGLSEKEIMLLHTAKEQVTGMFSNTKKK